MFNKEADFESSLISVLVSKGWEEEVLTYKTEKDLLRNWADILFDNNRSVDRLGDYPLTDGEMDQILDQIRALRTPLKLNGFINGKTVSIKRDNPDDKAHFGREVSLKIYDRREIAAGQSRYQIVRQPVFPARSQLLNDRRGDLMLLINGMPVIHIELKRSGVPITSACYQIEKYTREGVFTGLFSLVQIFVAMNPEESVYFANPGIDGKFNPDYYFHWADFNNEPLNDWMTVASSLLSIPMAHQLIGFYTVADDADGVLKVMRSYQYYAASAISDLVSKTRWDEKTSHRGGYIWHTTGSGKTMTSFKSAQLIANSGDADKVVFLTDRIELGTQSLKEYRAFADANESVQATENTYVLLSKLKSEAACDTLIVTSIQKMSNIRDEDGGRNASDIAKIARKRIVFIIDEAHRSTFGEMLPTIKSTFPGAVFIGFTGTPIFERNAKKHNDQTDIFGNELHRYSIADGIRDKNVLGFDPVMVSTFKDYDIRKLVALRESKADSEQDAVTNPDKAKIYYKFMDHTRIPMASVENPDGSITKGIEDYLPTEQYQRLEHKKMVLTDIKEHWLTLSHGGKFHAIFATSSIPEAIDYYRLFKDEMPELKVTCLFDPNIDNKGGFSYKEEGLIEIMTDYNARYGQDFTISTHAQFKKDISTRLAHKEQYKRVEREPERELDLLIVVDQMLTGFDSKWVNTLYLDKVLQYENIIQAFSRTNRLFGPDKPFGVIRYYRKPHTMEQNVAAAVKLYSGDKVLGLFVDKLYQNLEHLNTTFSEIEFLFKSAGIPDFHTLPDEIEVKKKFAQLFGNFNSYLEAAKLQGFRWGKDLYVTPDYSGKNVDIHILFTFEQYQTLLARYKELARESERNDFEGAPYEISGYLKEIDTGVIDADYMNSRFTKYLKLLHQDDASEEMLESAMTELHRSFSALSQEDQKYAYLFLHDIERGDLIPEDGKTFRDYITQYRVAARNDQIHIFAETLGLDEDKLRTMMGLGLNEKNINEFGRLDDLRKTVDKAKAKAYFESVEGVRLPPPKVNMKIDRILRTFITSGGFSIDKPST